MNRCGAPWCRFSICIWSLWHKKAVMGSKIRESSVGNSSAVTSIRLTLESSASQGIGEMLPGDDSDGQADVSI